MYDILESDKYQREKSSKQGGWEGLGVGALINKVVVEGPSTRRSPMSSWAGGGKIQPTSQICWWPVFIRHTS